MPTTPPLRRLMNDAAPMNAHESQLSYLKDDSSPNGNIHRNGWEGSGLEKGHGESRENGIRARDGNEDGNTNSVTNRGSAASSSLIVDNDDGDQQPDTKATALNKVRFRDRVGCLTWTWFTLTMATGGIANILYSSMPSATIDSRSL